MIIVLRVVEMMIIIAEAMDDGGVRLRLWFRIVTQGKCHH